MQTMSVLYHHTVGLVCGYFGLNSHDLDIFSGLCGRHLNYMVNLIGVYKEGSLK